MIRVMSGSIFDSGAAALVVPVNCRGVAGKGLAKEFKKRFPGWFKDYAEACRNGEIRLGTLRAYVLLEPGAPYIVNLPTKGDWRSRSELGDVTSGLEELAASIRNPTCFMSAIRSIAVPALGCGLGGLPWASVFPRIKRTLGRVPDLDVMVYPPQEDA